MKGQSLKQKTVGALLWNLLDRAGQQVLLFMVNILVANILSVNDYSLVGMLTIFSAVANIMLDSGFSAALIQKKEATDTDFSSVFWFNLGISFLIYFGLVASSPLIALYFSQPQLTELSIVIFLALPINSLTIIQSTILNKEVRFKLLTRINLTAMTVSGIASLIMACCHLGVWTLALQPVILAGIRTLLLWIYNPWRPTRTFSRTSIKSLFGFASSLLFASLINTCFLNIYSLVIGKIYPVKQLGYYTQGNKMCDTGVSMIYGSIQNATYPIFSMIQHERERLIRAYRKTIRFTSFVAFPVMAGLIVTARPIIELLLKEDWWPTIPFFQLISAGGYFTILTAVNNNFIRISGHSKGILKIEYYKIVITVVALLLTYDKPALAMVAGLVVSRGVVYLINMIYTSRFTGYSFRMQLHDSVPYLFLSFIMVVSIYPLRLVISNNLLLFATQTIVGVVIYIGCSFITGSKILKETIALLKKEKRT